MNTNNQQSAINSEKNESRIKAFFGTYKKIFKENFLKGFLQGVGIMLGIATTALMAVAVSGTFNSFTSGAVIKSSEVNTNFATLKTAIEGITSSQWTTSGANISYTAGNVGIGTSTFNSSFNIKSAGAAMTIRGSNDNVYMQVNTCCNPGGEISLNDSTGALKVYLTGSGAVTYINGGGNFGIGTATPSFKLDVAGDINATGCVKGSAGTVTGGGTCTSDQRLKKDISYYAHSLEKITQLKPASFGWKKEKYDWLKPYADKDNGLIAQDVEKVFPHLVKTDEKGFKTVSYSIEMEMHLIQSIKELKSLHDATVAEKLSSDKRVLSLEKENSELRKRLERIESVFARIDSNQNQVIVKK